MRANQSTSILGNAVGNSVKFQASIWWVICKNWLRIGFKNELRVTPVLKTCSRFPTEFPTAFPAEFPTGFPEAFPL